MKLARKLTLVFVLAMTLVLAISALFRIGREISLFETDMRRDHSLLGRALSAAVASAWRAGGETRALDLIHEANAHEATILIRFVRHSTKAEDGYPPPPERVWGALDASGIAQLPQATAEGDRLYTYVPVLVDGAVVGALELSESLAEEGRYVHTTMTSMMITTIAMAVVCGIMAMLLGVWFVGRPVRSLVDKARRVGQGDLSGKLVLRQHDEIGELAGEMNAMCDRLAEANQRIAAETRARIAALEQLRHADRLMTVGKLASGIAHELGTPLNVVSGRAKMILTREVDADEAVENAQIIVGQSDKMAKIIRQLLDFARSRGPQKATNDLRELASQTITLLSPLADKSGVKLVLGTSPPAARVEVDGAKVQQALANLVVNGIQSMPVGGTLSISIRPERVRPPADQEGDIGDYFCVEVRDEGEGIPEETMPHIFDPFFTTKPVGEGTGLGLSVSYGIIREHGGWIGVDSELGRGSKFSIYLPRDAAREMGQEARA